MNKLILAALAAAAAATAGCATGPEASTESTAVQREYVTGSNVARRKGEAPTDQVKMYSRESLENAYRTGTFGNNQTPPGGGSGPGT